jgi:ACT domain-containing protein
MVEPTAPAATPADRAVVTIVGPDRVGIIAAVANVLAAADVNIIDITQTVMREFFTMIMMVEMKGGAGVPFDELRRRLREQGEALSIQVEIQREDIFHAMHRV